MEELTLTVPALLFPAISLILLAYTNRFLSYAQLIRTLKAQYLQHRSDLTAAAGGRSGRPSGRNGVGGIAL